MIEGDSLQGREMVFDWAAGVTWGDISGIVGVVIYIGSYFSLQAGLIRGQGYLYAGLNATAATCVLLSLIEDFNLSSALIQITFIAISCFGMVRFYLLTHLIKFSDEEQAFLNVAAPNLHKLKARQLLKTGTWKTALEGTRLTEEGVNIDHLYFVLDGSARVVVANNDVAELREKSLVGEISCLTGMPASATVILSEPSRLFAMNVKDLNDFFARNQSVRHEMEGQFASQVSAKLIKANATLLAQRVKVVPAE